MSPVIKRIYLEFCWDRQLMKDILIAYCGGSQFKIRNDVSDLIHKYKNETSN